MADLTKVDLIHVEKSLSVLMRIGFIEEKLTDSGEKIYRSIVLPLKVKSNQSKDLTKFHHKNLIESADHVLQPEYESICRSVMFSLSQEMTQEFKNDVESFIRKLKTKYGSDEIQGKKLIKINLHAFPLTKPILNELKSSGSNCEALQT